MVGVPGGGVMGLVIGSGSMIPGAVSMRIVVRPGRLLRNDVATDPMPFEETMVPCVSPLDPAKW